MSTTPTIPSAPADVRAVVREKYGAIAEGRKTDCCAGSCCTDDRAEGDLVLDKIGYTTEQAAAIPEGANLGLGCGNPLQWANVQPGETVLDLGSGAGIDCFLAARETGPDGRVIGVDMTPAMIERARANLAKAGTTNVEFRLGEIEHLPVADGTVDVIISNCVINLSPDKSQVFREAFRALKPGGRALVSDLVLTRPLAAGQQRDLDLYIGCVAGASQREEYVAMMRDAGFTGVEIVHEDRYDVGGDKLEPGSPQAQVFAAVRSVKVRGWKR